MTQISMYTGSPEELWANEGTKANLKAIINKKHVVVDDKGNVEAHGAKRSCFSKLIHNHKMKNTESKYFAKKVNAAVQEYNKQVAKIAKPVFVNVAQIQNQIQDEQKKIADADVIIAKNVKAKAELLAPVKAINSYNADVNQINDKINAIVALDKDDADLELETGRLNTQNSNLYDKYSLANGWFYGIRTYNQGGDLEASIKKINEAGYTKKETAELTKDVRQVIENNARLVDIAKKKISIANDKKDAGKDQAALIGKLATKIAANDDKVNLSSLTDFVSIKNEIATLEKEVATQKEAIVNSAAYAACESQIIAANSAKTLAQAEIIKLSAQIAKPEKVLV